VQEKESMERMFRFRAKEYLWKMHYQYLQPINYQQLTMFKKKVKGYYFVHPYSFLRPETPTINFEELKDKETDSNKIEKHAIMSVLYGNIWNRPYSNNPFPYLAQNYHSFGPEDKQLVIDLYNRHYQRYLAAKNTFILQKIQQSQLQ
jgi:hypothetical protein